VARPTSLPHALALYLRSLEERAYSSETVKTRDLTLSRFLRFLEGRRVRDVRGVNEAHIGSYAQKLAYKKTRYGRPCTILTQRESLGVIHHFFAFLVKRRLILHDPTHDLERPRIVRLPRNVPTEAQARRLMNAPDRYSAFGLRDRAFLELLYGSGLRAGELRRLDLTDLDLDKGMVFVRHGKGRKDRTVPLSGRSIVALAAYLKDVRPRLAKRPREMALFLSLLGRRIGRSTLQGLMQKYARLVRLPPGTSLHSLRHACATHLLQGNANLRHVQAILGHAHLQSTVVYTRVNVRDLAKVLERTHPREREWRRRYNGR
jgi:integrase/recombinase XerD